jgi:PAS domain S-box-containing protein
MKKNLSQMMGLEFYLSSLSTEEYKKVIADQQPSIPNVKPLMSWDQFTLNYAQKNVQLKRKSDINTVQQFLKKEKLANNIDQIFKNQEFEGLIITDVEQNICWVNDGFTQMTGYPKRYALNKTPRFLQGEKTTIESKNLIREKLKTLSPFTGIITNYRKDNSEYECEVKIIPLVNNNIVTHFLALEKQVI